MIGSPRNKLKFEKRLNFKNTFLGKIPGKKCKAVTSDKVLSLNYVKDGSEDILANVTKKLAKKGDIVEMEAYEIVRRFASKGLQGLFYYGTDHPGRKEKQLGHKKHKFDHEIFNNAALKVIEIII